MKPHVRKCSDSGREDSLRDTNTLPTLSTARSLTRHVCIGDLEEELHKAFANARLQGGTDFVYERDCDAYALLDEFCKWNQMSEPACPLVVSGRSGSGKSALLANWLVQYRQRLGHRPRQGSTLEEPFVFCHAVGCTRHGVDVEQLLWRLLADLKQRFDLARNVPSEASRLSWELPRFLELAARKGSVIIIIDGLHRLQDKNGGETGLQWLPLRVPGNVRMIVTATNPGPTYLQLHEKKQRRVMSDPPQAGPSPLSKPKKRIGGDNYAGISHIPRKTTTEAEGIDDEENTCNHRRRKILMELSRRKWPMLQVGPLEDWRKRDIVEAFLRRSIVGLHSSSEEEPPASDASWSSKAPRETPTFLTGVVFEEDVESGETLKSGLVLFPSMVESILSSKATNSALYLRTLLRALEWAAMNSYDVRALLGTILTTASSVRALYNVIFDSIESGNQPTSASMAAAKGANEADGGLPALQRTVDYLVGIGSADRRNSLHDQHNWQQNQSSSQAASVTGDSFTLSEGSVVEVPSQADQENNKQVEQEERDKGEIDDGGGGKEDREGDDEMGDDYSEDDYEEEFEEDEEWGEGMRHDISHDQKVMRAHMDTASSADGATLMAGSSNISNERKGRSKERGDADIEKEGDTVDRVAPSVDTASAHDLTSRIGEKESRVIDNSTDVVSGTGGRSTLSEVPVYLAGGEKVGGLGVTVGRTMALLRVVRHGLWSQELWAILKALRAWTSAQKGAEGTEREAEFRLLRKLLKGQNRLMDTIRLMDVNRDGVISTEEFRSILVSMDLGLTERQVGKLIRSIDTDQNGELDIEEMLERFSQKARKMKRDIASGSKLRKDATNEGALSHEIKRSLTSLLSVLGVTYDGVKHNGEKHCIFVLGLNAEDLRQVVFQRYVPSTDTWHARLVRFFRALPPSPRSCEELPWHLKKCYRWHPLKNTLVDLRIFETMWTKTQLKRELMDYWKLLTEGPLHTKEKMEAGDLRNDRNSRPFSAMLQDPSGKGGGAGSVSAADVIAMGSSRTASTDKVAPFDIVFEYNHAIEGWQTLSRPTISGLGEMVHTVGDFLREMSHLVQTKYASPPFLRMSLAYDDLKRVGIAPELVALTGSSSTTASQEGSSEERSRNEDTNGAKPKGAPRDNLPCYRVAPFYYFQRWLWVQFPWMALSSISEDLDIKSNAVCFAEQGDLKDPQPEKISRFWSVNRVDPFGDPSVKVSDDRLRSRLKAELGRSATTTLLDTRSHSTLLGDIDAGMMSSASSRRHVIRAEAEEAFGRQLPTKRSRTWRSTASTDRLEPVSNKGSGGFGGFLSEEDSDISFALPSSGDLKTLEFESESFDEVSSSADSLRTKGSGGNLHESRADDALRQKTGQRWRNRRQNPKARGVADPCKTICILAGTNSLSPLPGKTLVETKSFLAASTSIFPTTVDEAMVLEAKDMALKMRRIHDVLQGEVAQKIKTLVEIKRKVEERTSQDAYTMSRTMAGERVVKALRTRLTKVRSTTTELERVGAFYVRIVDLCVRNPPKDSRHLRALEEQVFLSKQQTKDLSGKVRDLVLEKDAIERRGIHGLKAQLTRTGIVQQKVNARIEKLRERIQKNLNMPSEGEADQTTTNSMLREKYRAENRRRTLKEDNAKEDSMQEALEKLAMLVGAGDIDDITAKFKAAQERQEDLKAQGQTATLTSERLRVELEDCQKQRSDLELVEGGSESGILVDGGTANSDATPSPTSNKSLHREQRKLDDLVFRSSIRLKQARRKTKKAKGLFNDLRVGILHLVGVIDSVVRRDDNTGTLIPVRRRVRRLQAKVQQEKFPVTLAAARMAPAAEGHAAYGETAGRVAPPEDVDSQFGREREAAVQPGGSGLMDIFAIGQEENACTLLDACEERVRGVMEICGIKANEESRTTTTEARIAHEAFWHSGLSAAAVPNGSQPITEGPGTPSILQRLFMGRVKGFKSDGSGMDIRTLPPKARDNRFERSMAEVLRKKNEKLEMQETEENNLDRKAVATGVASFLEDALNSKSANIHLRRANMLVMGKQGKRAGFGLVMDDVLSGAHIDVYNLASAARKTSTTDGCFLGRNDLSSAARAQVLSSRRKQETRKKASLETNIEQANPA